ncbi:TetR/AcrR family transcriptional regulator [Priestia megaterium]|uniref:TetR/AcrR family transcriptional regulator n=1 Tax=Priestia megaterium TaxID=1404 RepID=UPI00300B081E
MSDEKQQQTAEKRGRPLDLSRNRVILETTIDLLAENGYDSLTIEAVASKAKVGKGTIYRRWSSKTELVIDAAVSMSRYEVAKEKLNKNQDLRGQLIELISLLFLEDNKNYQKAMNAICNSVSWDEKLAGSMRDAFYWRHRNMLESILEPYVRENQITNDDIELIADIGPALVMYNVYSGNKSTKADYAERIVDKLMMPIVLKQV